MKRLVHCLLEITITARRFFILGLLLEYSSMLNKIYPRKPLRKLLDKTSMVKFSFTLVAICQSLPLKQSVFLEIFQTLTKFAFQSTCRKRDKLLCCVSKNLCKQDAHNQ